MNDLAYEVKHNFGGGVYVKEVNVKAGHVLVQHKHTFDHLSYLVKGSVELTIEDKKEILFAPSCIEIKANTYHGIISLEDVTWLCIHATDCEDVSKVDEILIHEESLESEAMKIAEEIWNDAN